VRVLRRAPGAVSRREPPSEGDAGLTQPGAHFRRRLRSRRLWPRWHSVTAYELTFRGEAGPVVHAAFEEFPMSRANGSTTIHCTVRDGAALHGVIERVFSLGLELIDLHQVTEIDVRRDER
jgi:hypothetical protein